MPGLFWFRARVIVRANDYSPLPPDGPTRPIQRLPVPGKVPTFPHPEPPLLFSSCLCCHAIAAGEIRKNRMSYFLLVTYHLIGGLAREVPRDDVRHRELIGVTDPEKGT